MPDLTYLIKKKVAGSYLLSSLIGSDNNLDRRFIQYRRLFVRLADKAIYEYLIARDNVIKQINNKDGGIYIIPIIDHLENCVNTLRRLFYLFDRIKNSKQNLFFIDRNLRRLTESKSSQIVKVRGLIEHIDNYISRGQIKKEQTIALDISEDTSEIMIGEQKLSTNNLCSVIKHFHTIAAELAIYNAPGVSEKHFKVIKLKL